MKAMSTGRRGWASIRMIEHLKRTCLRTQFNKLASDDGFISLQGWLQLAAGMGVDLTEVELTRIFERLDTDGSGGLDFFEFVRGIRKNIFFQSLAKSGFTKQIFHMPEDYDYTKSTNDVYGVPAEAGFFGMFSDIRSKLDYSYHANYSFERQIWQDGVIQHVVSRTDEQPNPWVVFTAGAMGAGKGHAMSWMSAEGIFPLEHIVHIDPDNFKQQMPEWRGYTSSNSFNAGTLCHRESGYIQEIATEVSLQNCQNTWVDGSLRDGEWFKQVFQDIRKRYPHYRIAIFWIYASTDVVRERCAKRAKLTGRHIPDHLINASQTASEDSIRILTPYSDLIGRINNDKRTPVLTLLETIDHSGNWIEVQKHFDNVQPAPYRFPESLAPQWIEQTILDSTHLSLQSVGMDGDWGILLDKQIAGYLFSVPPDIREMLLGDYTMKASPPMTCSPFDVVAKLARKASGTDNFAQSFTVMRDRDPSLDSSDSSNSLGKAFSGMGFRESSKSLGGSRGSYNLGGVRQIESFNMPRMDVPGSSNLQHYVFVYPNKNLTLKEISHLPSDDPNLHFLIYGGYVYFNDEENVELVVSFTPNKVENSPLMIQFAPGQPIEGELDVDWHPVPKLRHLAMHSTRFAWIPPGSNVAGIVSWYGGFVFELGRGKHMLFPIATDPTY